MSKKDLRDTFHSSGCHPNALSTRTNFVHQSISQGCQKISRFDGDLFYKSQSLFAKFKKCPSMTFDVELQKKNFHVYYHTKLKDQILNNQNI